MFFKEFELPNPPEFAEFYVNILDLGAVADGKKDVKPFIDEAMTICHENGGGHIIVPKGEFFCDGPIHFKSNVDLHLEKNALIRFTDEYEKYLPVVFVRIEGIRCYNYSPLIYGIDLENIAVTGEGTLDGNAFKWWDMMHNYVMRKKPLSEEKLCIAARDGVPVEERIFGTVEDEIRPYFLQFMRCKNVLIEGVRFEHSPFWTVSPTFCENVVIRGITHRSEKTLNGHTSYNTDSVNLDSCRNCLVEDITVESSCDDSICVKSGKDHDGLEVNIPTENVLVRNCTIKNSGSVAVVGSETSGGIRNVCFKNITAVDCLGGINIKSVKGRGNVIENIHFENIKIVRSGTGVQIDLSYMSNCGDESKIPQIRNISMENITVKESVLGTRFAGIEESVIKNLHIKNLKTSGVYPQQIEFVENLEMDNVTFAKNEHFDTSVLGGIKK